jgi:hypothetical protein
MMIQSPALRELLESERRRAETAARACESSRPQK